MTEAVDILKVVCCKLEQASIPYMLTGSLAANVYAVPRMTRDIDIVIEVDTLDIDSLFQIFKDDFYIDKDAINEAIEYQSIFNIIHQHSIFKVDFIIRKNENYRITEFQRRRQMRMEGDLVWVVAPEDLIISKLDWAKDSCSQMQIKDIQNLFSSVNLDKEYIYKWIKILELNSIFDKVAVDG